MAACQAIESARLRLGNEQSAVPPIDPYSDAPATRSASS